MRAIVSVTFAISSLMLASCGQGAGDAPAGQGVAAGPAAFSFQPGQYRATVEVKEMTMPGMTPDMQKMIKSNMSSRTAEFCMTGEHAGIEAMKQHMGDGNCQFAKFEASGGTVDTEFTCKGGRGGEMHATSHGTYTPTGSVVDINAQMTMAGGPGMTMHQIITTQRIGDCKS